MTRRDFLKTMALLPFIDLRSLGMPAARGASAAADAPNILVLVFDSFSARNISLYGYPRHTTPNLERIAHRSTVYHHHYSGGNYTPPGTASLLTGTYPWTHRALYMFGRANVREPGHNIFRALGEAGYHTLAYTHNPLALDLLGQFRSDLSELKGIEELSLYADWVSSWLFPADYGVAQARENEFRGYDIGASDPTSLFVSVVDELVRQPRLRGIQEEYGHLFPRGLPEHRGAVFILETVVDWLASSLPLLPAPYLGYFHVMPPHEPYNTRHEFVDVFRDGWTAPRKPARYFTQGISDAQNDYLRRLYDEYIAYVDAEIGRLFDALDRSGVLDHTCLVLTTDHGELFERGIWMHLTSVLYEPLIHTPLLISFPGQRERRDVFTPTASVDLLPTLAHLAGAPVPDWCEGKLLPPFGEASDERSVFAVEGKHNPAGDPLTTATLAMVKGRYKVVNYLGYESVEDACDLYDLEDDPEEMHDLSETRAPLAEELKWELRKALQEAETRGGLRV